MTILLNGVVGCSSPDAAPPAKTVNGAELDKRRSEAARGGGGPEVGVSGLGGAGATGGAPGGGR
jgi:hypothetical protein